MSEGKLPQIMWFGTTDGQWPIQCWESATHAMYWLREGDSEGRRRRLWQASLMEVSEYEVIAPEPYLKEL